MIARALMWLGLITVAGAAAVLSFAALRDLARICGFTTTMAPLLPVVIDAGAAVASLVWLGRWAPDPARRYARGLALTLLGGSVAGNALGHGLGAYGARPHWTVVVAVSAVAPAVLAAVVHLVVLATRPVAAVVRVSAPAPDCGPGPAGPPDHEPGQVDHEPGPPDHEPDHAGPGVDQADRGSTTMFPTDLDLAAELASIAAAQVEQSGEADQAGPPPDHPGPAMPNQAADDTTLAADLHGWAADQGGVPSRNAVMGRYGIGATRANRLLAGLTRTDAGPVADRPDHGADQVDHGPDQGGPATHDGDGEVTR